MATSIPGPSPDSRKPVARQPTILSATFEVSGCFHSRRGYRLRSQLDIIRRSHPVAAPDVMAVMMNPGASGPLDGEDNSREPAHAKPDQTQFQIMRVMNAAKLHHARIINLSDLRTSDSSEFFSFLRSAESATVDHSIFDPSRADELKTVMAAGVPVIYAWGVSKSLTAHAQVAIKALAINDPVGQLKPGTTCAYYHPLPPVHSKQVAWVDQIARQLKRSGAAAQRRTDAPTKE